MTLAKMWLSDVVTSRSFGWYTADGREQGFATQGQARFYADGRVRSADSPGMAGLWKFTLMELTPADVDILRAWLASGALLLARDHRGQSMYGAFFEAEFAENKALSYDSTQNTYRGSITLRSVDVVEGV